MKEQDSSVRPEAVLFAALVCGMAGAGPEAIRRAGALLESGLTTPYDDLHEKLAVILRPDLTDLERVLAAWLAYAAILRPETAGTQLWLGPAIVGDDEEEALRLGGLGGLGDLDVGALLADLRFLAGAIAPELRCAVHPEPDGGVKFSLRQS